MSTETFAFQAEINQLLSLIINTFYSNKDVFLRELISNSSDAIDKAKYKTLSSGDGKLQNYCIELTTDEEAKTLTIGDNGIGLTRDDMINCLGTIANSGTKQFMEALQSGTDMSMIGQFGVGFYSAYLVADTVQVFSKHSDSPHPLCWESKAGGSFTITEMPDYEDLNVGTKIVLHMKEDCMEYIKDNKIKEIVKTHSEYITYPINIWETKTITKEVPDDSVDVDEVTEFTEGGVETVEEDAKAPEQKMKSVEEVVSEWKQLNTQKPLWQMKPEDVSEEEYGSFY